MKSLILYSARTQLTPAHVAFPVPGGLIFIRIVGFDGDMMKALDAAGQFMVTGETVLNTIPFN